MPSITVKNIPPKLYERLKRAAETHHRSINSEIIVCIERAVGPEKLDVDGVLAAARRLREWTADYVIDDETIDTAKRAGRL